MKSLHYIVKLFALFVAAILAGDCVEPLHPNAGPNVDEGAQSLQLSVRCGKTTTKANPYPGFPAGESAYNENKLVKIDWFIFTNQNPAESDVAVLHGRVNWTGDEHADASLEFLAKSINMDQYFTKYKDNTGKAVGSVFVIANLPDNYQHTEDLTADNSNTGGIHEEGGAMVNTLGGLLDLRIGAKLDSYTQTNAADYTSAVFKPQDSFVMTSECQSFELSEQNPGAAVHAELTRLAVKLSMEIDIASAIDEVEVTTSGRDTTWLEYLHTWYPDTRNVQVYLSYADSVSNLRGTPQEYSHANFFTYNRYSFKSEVDSPSESALSATFHYFPYEEDGYTKPASSMMYHNVSGSPFYTYPITWETSAPYAPFIKIIIPWKALQEEVTTEKHYYIDHTTGQPNMALDPVPDTLVSVTRAKWNNPANAQEFYYKIAIPSSELTLRRNQWMWIKLDVAILGSRNDDELVTTLAGRYYVLDWDDPVQTAGDLSQGNYLSVARDTFYVYGENALDIPVSSSHNVSAVFTKVQYKTFNPLNSASTTLNNVTSWTNAIDVANLNMPASDRRTATLECTGRSLVRFNQRLRSDLENASKSNRPDVSPYTFNVTISNGVSPDKKIVIVQTPPLVIQADPNSDYKGANQRNNQHYGYVYVNKYTGTEAYTYGDYYSRQSLGSVNGISSTNSTSSNQNMYIISASVVPSMYVIADARSRTWSYLGFNDYGWTYPSRALSEGDNQQYFMFRYYPAEEGDEGKNKISPKFRIASSYGQTGALSYQNCQRRCATYQEDGIPAGRWRVPTKAEIEFMIRLSTIEVIPKLFGTEQKNAYNKGGYYTADGGVIYPWSDNTYSYLTKTQVENGTNSAKSTNWVRCVYDEWYWGTADRLPVGSRNEFVWGDHEVVW